MLKVRSYSPAVNGLDPRILPSSASLVGQSGDHAAGAIEVSTIARGLEGAASAEKTGGTIDLKTGSGAVQPFRNVYVSDGSFGFETDYNIITGKQTFIGASGLILVDVIGKSSTETIVAQITLKDKALANATSFARTQTFRYVEQGLTPPKGPFATQRAGKILSTGTAVLTFPDGVPHPGGPSLPYLLVFRPAH